MIFRTGKCLTRVLCVPKQFQPNIFAIKQHLIGEMLSPLAGNLLTNGINDDSNKTLIIGDSCGAETTKKAPEQNDNNMELKPDIAESKRPTETIRQHIKDEVVSSLSGNIFMNKDGKETNKDALLKIKTDVPELFRTKAPTINFKEHHRNEVLSPLSENIFFNKRSNQNATTPMTRDQCGKEALKKAQECNIILSPPVGKRADGSPDDSLKGFKSEHTATIKEQFKTKSPPLSGRICVAMQVRFQVKPEMNNKIKECKILPNCQNQPNSNNNCSKPNVSSTSASDKTIPYNNPCKPKSK